MDSIKEKMPIIIAVIVAIAICGIAFYFLEKDGLMADMSISGKILAVMEDGSRLQVSRRKVCDIKDFLDERSI